MITMMSVLYRLNNELILQNHKLQSHKLLEVVVQKINLCNYS